MTITFVGDWLPTQSPNLSLLFNDHTMVGNLECIVSATAPSGNKAHSVILEKSAYQNIRSSGFAALNLANNHVLDAGLQAFREMQAFLNELKEIQFYGTTEQPYAKLEVAGTRYAIVGCLEPCRSRGSCLFPEEEVHSLIHDIRPNFDKIFITPHWGKESEYAHHPAPRQRKLAAKWIHAGADAVVGHHPHVIQGSEIVAQQPIYYSVGNFDFPHIEGRDYPATSYGLAVSYDPSVDHWRHNFLSTKTGQHQLVETESDAESILQQHFVRLSDDLTQWSGPSEYLAWARRVGPIYIPKSWRSWRGRMRKRFLLNFAKCLVWSVMPSTCFLTLGYLFKDEQHLDKTAQTFQQLHS